MKNEHNYTEETKRVVRILNQRKKAREEVLTGNSFEPRKPEPQQPFKPVHFNDLSPAEKKVYCALLDEGQYKLF